MSGCKSPATSSLTDYRKSSFLKNYFDLVMLPWTLVIPGTFRIQFLTFWWSRLVQQTNIDLERVILVFLTHFRLKHVMTEFMWTQETDTSDTALKRALHVRGNRPLKRLLTTIIDGEKEEKERMSHKIKLFRLCLNKSQKREI